MMSDATWREVLPVDPIPALLEWQDDALHFFVRSELLGEPAAPIECLWYLPEAMRLVRKQQANGAWKYGGQTRGGVPGQNYSLLETFRTLRVLIEQYGFTRAHPALQEAAGYIFSCQTGEGDLRGILGNQYMPYYCGALLELLIKVGYGEEGRVLQALEWLLSMRQTDGGWIVPAQAVPPGQRTPQFWSGPPVAPERSLPHAHLATGMVLRAFAVHPAYRRRAEVIAAGERLKSRFFQPDRHHDRQAPAYWLKFQFPYWWSNLLSALETLAHLGFTREDPGIARGLNWFLTHQEADGLWPTGYGAGKKAEANRRWVGLAVSRVLKRYFRP